MTKKMTDRQRALGKLNEEMIRTDTELLDALKRVKLAMNVALGSGVNISSADIAHWRRACKSLEAASSDVFDASAAVYNAWEAEYE
jgi:hypothetical protein